MEENKEPEFEPIDPQEPHIISAMRDNVFKTMVNAQWKESLLNPQVSYLTFEEVVERYGSVLEPKQLQNIKDLINGKIH